MFDLGQAIARWRREMLNAGIPRPTIDELESHLREEIERQMRAGLDARFALDSAVAQIGRAIPLKEEFAISGEIGRGFLRKIKSWFHFGGFYPSVAEDWDPVAKQALDFAAEESRHFRHDFIGTEHVLMGLIRLDSGIVRKVLRRLGVEDNAVRVEIERLAGKGPMHQVPPGVPYTPRATNALRLAGRESRKLNHKCVNPGHIFLGLILEGDGVAWWALKNLGIQIDDARRELLAEMLENPGTA